MSIDTIKAISRIAKYFFRHWKKRESICLARSKVDWDTYNQKAEKRYWVCGTSLIYVADHLLKSFIEKKVADIKIILPDTAPETSSNMQLKEYSTLILEQLKLADDSYNAISGILEKNELREDEHLRKYSGIMYSNITIFDEDAFISFYDATGRGDDNITVHFHGEKERGYQLIENMFKNLWKKSI